MSNVVIDATVVAASWTASALLTLALATVQPQEPPKKQEEQVVVTGQRHVAANVDMSPSFQIFIIEQKLEEAEDDLEEIAKIIEEKKALEAAKKLDAEERGKRK